MSPVDQDQYFPLPSFEEKLQDQPSSCTFRPAHKALSSISCPISAHPSSAKAQHHGDQEVRHAHFPYDDVHGHDRDLLRSPAPPKSTTTTSDVSSKWMTSRMRLMRTLKNPDGVMVRNKGSNHPVGDGYRLNGGSSSNDDTATRVCADCSTTKTPLWRGGPQGPKSLCNACGIRRRKAAAAAAMNGGISTPNKEASSVNATDKGRAPDDGGERGAVPIKKRRRLVPPSGADQEKLQREEEKEFGVGLSWNSEEKEAAILLMALSSDMIFGRVW